MSGQKFEVDTTDTPHNTPLHHAVLDNDLGRAKSLVAENPNLLKILDEEGHSVLHIAAENGFLDIVEWLVDECEVDIRLLTPDQENALHLAASIDSLKLREKYEEDEEGYKEARKKYKEIVELLLERTEPSDRDAVTKEGMTALDIAMREGNLQIVQKLHDYQVQFRLKPAKKNGNTKNAFDYALCFDQVHIIADYYDDECTEISDYYLNSTTKMFNGDSPLQVAAAYNGLRCVKFLLEKKPDALLQVNAAGNTALHLAAANNRIRATTFLCQQGDIGYKEQTNNKGNTPFLEAVEQGSIDAALVLLDNRANYRAKNSNQDTYLHFIFREDRGHFLTAFLGKTGDLYTSQRNLQGKHPLHLAAETGKCAILTNPKFEQLLQYHLNAIHRDMELGTAYDTHPFYLAAQNGHVEFLKGLVALSQSSEDIRVKYREIFEQSKPAIKKAAKNGHLAVLEYFSTELDQDVLSILCEDGYPLHAAVAANHTEMVKWLLKKNRERVKKDATAHNLLLTTNQAGKLPIEIAEALNLTEIVKLLKNISSEDEEILSTPPLKIEEKPEVKSEKKGVKIQLFETSVRETAGYSGTTGWRPPSNRDKEDLDDEMRVGATSFTTQSEQVDRASTRSTSGISTADTEDSAEIQPRTFPNSAAHFGKADPANKQGKKNKRAEENEEASTHKRRNAVRGGSEDA